MRRKRLYGTGLVLGTLALAVGAAQPAAAADLPSGGCGSQTLVTVQETIDAVDWRFAPPEERPEYEARIAMEDANDDGLLCIKQFEPNQGQDKHFGAEDYIVTSIGDNRAVGRL
ncbi:hypothetical protein [Naasia sp. SYSU D00948]|uniref:hypothetical protein n=1 Tax=Naasia sp. SYSU D00948 TaxID=2817379 RepID=UPI001B30C142|nr:hypothetical protein [Naasia sp. SYSU D00948]